MKRLALCLAALLAASVLAQEIPDDPSAMIRTLNLPNPDTQRAPYPFWVSPNDGLLIEFPFPVVSVAGRGFRVIRDEKDAGDVRAEWVAVPHRVPQGVTDVSEIPPPYTLWVNPQFEATQRVLHVTLGDGKVYTFLFSTPLKPEKPKEGETAQPPVAFARARFRAPVQGDADADRGASPGAAPGGPSMDASPAAGAGNPQVRGTHGGVTRSESAPEPTLRELTPEAEEGLLDFVRLLGALPRMRAEETATQNPVYETVFLEPAANTSKFGDTHAIRTFCVCRDTTSGALGLGVVVENLTNEKLTFDPQSWKLRVGHGAIYDATASRGGIEVGPKETVLVQFTIARDAQGRPLQVAVSSMFTPSVRLTGRSPAKPIQLIPVELP